MRKKWEMLVGRFLRIANQVGEGLATAHERGIVRRDVKAENILVAKGEPVELDFGYRVAPSSRAKRR
ncbi:MAG TPA: hypothetical protein VEK15_31725 [Vicinamibacteria bacterium]|nr:hypothetical protein [Vicinamibacteria bacterium]